MSRPALPVRLHRALYWLAYRLLRLWWRLRRPTGRGACVVVHDGERLLVVRTSYRRGWALPGGWLGRGEAPCDAARRELAEETGIVAPAAELVELAPVEAREAGRRVRTLLFAWRPEPLPSPRVDGREVVWAGYRPLAALAGEPMTPALRKVVRRGLAGMP